MCRSYNIGYLPEPCLKPEEDSKHARQEVEVVLPTNLPSRTDKSLSPSVGRSILDFIGQNSFMWFLFRAFRNILTYGSEVYSVLTKKRLSGHSLLCRLFFLLKSMNMHYLSIVSLLVNKLALLFPFLYMLANVQHVPPDWVANVIKKNLCRLVLLY